MVLLSVLFIEGLLEICLLYTSDAADGITFTKKETRTDMFLSTGGRGDLLVEVPETEGTYCIVATGPAMGMGPMGATGASQAIVTVQVIDDGSAPTGALPSDEDLAILWPYTLHSR